MTCLKLALAFSLLAAPFAASAQAPAQPPTPAPSPAAAARPWQVDWGQYYCSIVRRQGEGRPFATAFVAVPGSSGMSIRLVAEPGAELPTNLNRIVLMPAGTVFPVDSNIADGSRVAMRSLYGLTAEFREQLLAATEMQLNAGDRIRARVPLDGIRGAAVAHRRCMSEVAQEWGIDEAALAALSRRPRTTNFNGLRPEDYPADAVRRARQGRVVMRIAIDAGGRATDCVPVVSSGSLEIDAVACRVSMNRGRYEAGRDADGRPVATRSVFTVTFFLPRQ